MKKIFVSTLGFWIICMVFGILINMDIIVFQFSNQSYQESVKLDIISAVVGIGIAPLLIFFLIATRRKKVKRRAFSKDTKQKVLKRQNHQCKDCGDYPKNWEFDHIGSRGDNSAKNCQALCLDCHRDKTKREARQSKK
jgi:hypothetical protein